VLPGCGAFCTFHFESSRARVKHTPFFWSLAMVLPITVTRSTTPKKKPALDDQLGFGRYFSDHMYMASYEASRGWFDARIVPYGPIATDPAAGVFHYGQAMFEGSKAFAQPNGGFALFRPLSHAKRLNAGAPRLCMPTFPEEDFVEACKALVRADSDWVPTLPGTSLYLRPTLIGTEGFLGVRPATTYTFFIIASPVASYYGKAGLKPVRIWVETEFVRAPRGGVGSAKAGANYVASLLAAMRAKKEGFDQVLWLDGNNHDTVEEVGTMNLFVVLGQTLVTPPLSDSILAGVTRDSVLVMAKEMGLTVEERPISMKELAQAHASGALKEVLGTGTAAVISPVGELTWAASSMKINGGQPGPVAQKLYESITSLQRGARPDTHGWMLPV
jgi:branched-chain amino acid aminotransferase